tara:strand:+ start:5532 stop:6161 length:630 start_codon:yes stop_codon:yes gene_type:complete
MPIISFFRSVAVAALLLAPALAGSMQAQAQTPAQSQKNAGLWEAVRTGGAFAMMRHALAPGTGDPQSVVIGDCTTQRNLSDAGRAQARRIGAAFRQNGIDAARVYTSEWCRCAETARLLGIGPVESLSALNSFFADRGREAGQTAALVAWLGRDDPARNAGTPLVLVTHQVNITALTGVYPRSGEIVVARRAAEGKIEVLGRLFPADAR